MRVLMLVATSVATDTRVLREATSLVSAGHQVHIIGRSVPEGYEPPEGVTVSSVGTSSVFRAEGGQSLAGKKLAPHVALARWVLLPQHRASAFGRWASGAVADGLTRTYDVVHAHDFTALAAGAHLAEAADVPLIYDSHELWSGRPREHRPTPLADLRERRLEAQLGGRAATVITVGEGVARALRSRYGWDNIVVVRNTFPEASGERAPVDPAAGDTTTEDAPGGPLAPVASVAPAGLVYAGRIGAYRELEVIAAASEVVDLPITLMGPSDETWLGRFDPRRTTVAASVPTDDVEVALRLAGLALVTHSDRWENHRLAMPNKLFHAVRAGVPVVATDVGELGAIVRQHGLGTLYTPGDAGSLVKAIARAQAEYPQLLAAVRAAAPALSWAHDEHVLLEAYKLVGGAHGRHGGPLIGYDGAVGSVTVTERETR